MTRGDYPQPPTDLAVNSDVEVMYFRYGLYREGMDTLAAMANFCLTVLEASAKGGQRSAAAKKYAIAPEVLSQLGRLVSEKGGREARKAKGTANEFTTTEKRWIDSAVKLMIRRAAEVAYAPNWPLTSISLADLLPLQAMHLQPLDKAHRSARQQ